ncbi:MAG: SPW repeat protein [Proteobacteria bacterium]|nr:SPW repeat protein [Pseudomonadota bacterium]
MRIRWQDWLSVLLGAWLATSPHVQGYWLNHPATENAYGVGAVIVVFNLMVAIRLVDAGEEILNALIGFWLICAPYLLGFSGESSAKITAITVGVSVMALAILQMLRLKDR